MARYKKRRYKIKNKIIIPIITFIIILIIISFIFIILSIIPKERYADEIREQIDQSPINLEEYFEQGGEHHFTEFGEGKLRLLDTYNSGYWESPTFYIDDPDLMAFWNRMQGLANWNEFGSDYATTNPGFEEDLDYGWKMWHFNGVRSSEEAHSGSWSYEISSNNINPSGAIFSDVSDTLPLDEQYNIIPVTEDDSVHLTYWVKTDITYGKMMPKLMFLKVLGNNVQGSDISELAVRDKAFITAKSGDFVRVQAEFYLDGVIPDNEYTYYAYPWIKFEEFNTEAPTSKVWIDDIQLFKESKITIQARTSQDADCSNMKAWSERPERLLYNNYITVPAPVAKCIQFKINLKRIDVSTSPELENLELAFSKAYEFTRPIEDYNDAVFDYPVSPIVPLHNEQGELYNEAQENIRFSGMMVSIQTVNYTIQKYGETQGPELLGDYVCNFAEKYGLNLIKGNAQWWFSTEEEIVQWLDYHAPMVEKCKEKGIYFYLVLTPHSYANAILNENLCQAGSGYCGAWEFMDDSILEVYKDYLDIVFNYEYNGIPIKNDPAFVFTYLMNEKTLLRAWRFDKLDGIYKYDPSQNQEVSPYWIGKLTDIWNNWVMEKYPTFNELMSAWDYTAVGPFVGEDGTCTQATYGTDDCRLIMLTYSYRDDEGYEKRVEDLVKFFVQREEFVYSELKNHINNELGSNILISGGKPLWGMFPTMRISSQVLDNQDIHEYLPEADGYWTDTIDHLDITNEPIIPKFSYEMLGVGLDKSIMNNKPKIIGETTYIGFSEHIAENILLSLLSANAGWDLYVLYSLNHKMVDDNKMKNYNLQANAPLLALEPTASRLFRRDITRAPKENFQLTRKTALDYINSEKPYYQNGWIDPANTFFYELGISTFDADYDQLPPLSQDINPPYITNNFIYDVEQRKVKITTPGTEGIVGDYEGDIEDIGFMQVQLNEIQGLPTYGVFITSIYDEPLEAASDLLLTLVSKADNSNHLWDTYHMRAYYNDMYVNSRQYGEAPVWMAAVEADITLDIDQVIIVYPLNKIGQRTAESFVVEPVAGQVTFSVGGEYKTPWYEIIIQGGAVEDCFNGIDDDGDSLIDCEDILDCPAPNTIGNCDEWVCNPGSAPIPYQWEQQENLLACQGDCSVCDVGATWNCGPDQLVCVECENCEGTGVQFDCIQVLDGNSDPETCPDNFCCGSTCVVTSYTYGEVCGEYDCAGGNIQCVGITYECSTQGDSCAFCIGDETHNAQCDQDGFCVDSTPFGCPTCEQCVDQGVNAICDYYSQGQQDNIDPNLCVDIGWSCDGLGNCVEMLGGEICDNGIDDDGDGLIDCYDPDCTCIQGYALDIGKNFISIPMILSDMSVEYVFGEILENLNSIYTYENGEWEVYHKENQQLNTISQIIPKQAYIVVMNTTTSWDLEGNTVIENGILETGWNLVGISRETPISILDYFTELGNPEMENITSIYEWNGIGNYILIEDYVSTNFEPGKLYWIELSAPIEFAPTDTNFFERIWFLIKNIF